MSDKATISLLPSGVEEWGNLVDFPHMTLVYAGEKLTVTSFNELAKDASMLSVFTRPIRLLVKGKERFGENQNTEVLTLQPSWELWAMRRAVEKWNASEFDFKPHVTIGPPGTALEYTPRVIRFDKIAATWGDEKLIFRLGYSD
jgi:2'-5' RNA ligase